MTGTRSIGKTVLDEELGSRGILPGLMKIVGQERFTAFFGKTLKKVNMVDANGNTTRKKIE